MNLPVDRRPNPGQKTYISFLCLSRIPLGLLNLPDSSIENRRLSSVSIINRSIISLIRLTRNLEWAPFIDRTFAQQSHTHTPSFIDGAVYVYRLSIPPKALKTQNKVRPMAPIIERLRDIYIFMARAQVYIILLEPKNATRYIYIYMHLRSDETPGGFSFVWWCSTPHPLLHNQDVYA